MSIASRISSIEEGSTIWTCFPCQLYFWWNDPIRVTRRVINWIYESTPVPNLSVNWLPDLAFFDWVMLNTNKWKVRILFLSTGRKRKATEPWLNVTQTPKWFRIPGSPAPCQWNPGSEKSIVVGLDSLDRENFGWLIEREIWRLDSWTEG